MKNEERKRRIQEASEMSRFVKRHEEEYWQLKKWRCERNE